MTSFTMDQAENVAKSLNKAMKGFGTDESRLIKEIVSHNNAQRQMIKQKYLTMFGKTLEDDLKSEIKGHFLNGVLSLLEPLAEYEAKIIHKAIKGIGTDEKVLTETLCPKESHEIEILKSAYKRLFDKNLEEDVANDLSGDLGKIYRSIVSGGREDSRKQVDNDKAKKEAQELYDAGEGKFGTDESSFIRILCSRSFPQLNAIFEEYKKISGNDVEKAVKNEMSGDLERACLAIIKSARNKPAYFAELLKNTMDGIGTRDEDLIRILVSRSEVDLSQIKKEYSKQNGKSLYDAVKSEISGDYEKLFLALIEIEI
ncbi:unnamed protein product [Brachionus calyciflorus]|uniref:Annexin n=1 Tax=Brachionus calyciflorus TaxID=104777 RepID=A0A814BSW2_9BILA|nr:unnamed protein product [Brachionus calyciflorus]